LTVIARRRTLTGLIGERGTAVIEYALVLPALLLCVLGTLDTARLFWTSATLQRAIASAARCGGAALPNCTTARQIKDKAVAEAWSIQLDASAIDVVTRACGIRVSVTYAFTFTIPGFSPIALRPSTCYAARP
jgi:Flp pilus assembly protein TadG